MQIRPLLTKYRSRERVLFVSVGIVFGALAFMHAWRHNWSIALILGFIGIATTLLGAKLPEAHLRVLGLVFILINVLGGVAALIAGVRFR